MVRGVKIASVFLAALALAGCWQSATPLLNEADARCPYAQTTVLSIPVIGANGQTDWTPTIRVTPDGTACLIEAIPDETQIRVVFAPLDGEWMLTQELQQPSDPGAADAPSGAEAPGGKPPRPGADASTQPPFYAYRLARVSADALAIYQPQCSDFSVAGLTDHGLDGTCTFTSVEQLRRAARAWIALDRPSQMSGRRPNAR